MKLLAFKVAVGWGKFLSDCFFFLISRKQEVRLSVEGRGGGRIHDQKFENRGGLQSSSGCLGEGVAPGTYLQELPRVANGTILPSCMCFLQL